jgi:hypothetical protein
VIRWTQLDFYIYQTTSDEAERANAASRDKQDQAGADYTRGPAEVQDHLAAKPGSTDDLG